MGMQVDQIRESLKRKPFQPFLVHLADGRRFAVPHPEFAWLIPNGRSLFVVEREEYVHRIDTMLVTSVSDPMPEE